jgi:hypothetical protein
MIFYGDPTRLEYNRLKVKTILYPGEKWQKFVMERNKTLISWISDNLCI